MNTFAFPDNAEDAKSLLPWLIAALAISLPILLHHNQRLTGFAPKGENAWLQASGRMIAVVAVLYSSLAGLGRSPVALEVGFIATLVLFIIGFASPRIMRLAVLSFVALLVNVLLFPAIG